MIYLYIYFLLGMLIAIPLGRKYWLEFRSSNHKSNIVLPLKIFNRIVDSFVFLTAWIVYTVIYPLYFLELLLKPLIKKIRERG